MASCYRDAYWGTAFVSIDINNDGSKNTYKDPCGNIITVKKGPYTNGYKKLYHTVPRGSHIYSIKRGNSLQVGLGNLRHTSYREAIIIYLSYDESNLVPLLVGLTINGEIYEYYCQEDYFSSNMWYYFGKANGDQLPPKLPEISAKLTELFVLRLNATGELYYANGEYYAPDTNKNAKISVNKSATGSTVYSKYTHTPSGGIDTMRLLSTKGTNNKRMPFDPPVYVMWYSKACVYYWSGDISFTRPLLLELSSGRTAYFKYEKGGWTLDNEIRYDNLKGKLDEENCAHNNAHILDVSKTQGPYYLCPSGCGVKITVSYTTIPENNYSKCSHSISTQRISTISASTFRNNTIDQTGLQSVNSAQNVNVFFYPKTSNNPLLIFYESGGTKKCFKRVKGNENGWEEVTEDNIRPTGVSDHTRIKKLLIWASSPEVTIKLEQVPGKSYQSDGNETINIEKTSVIGASGYSQITHRIAGKTLIVKSITHGNKSQTVQDTITFLKDPLDNIVVFYSSSDSKCSKPLLLEFKLQSVSKYTYYEKTKNENEWMLYSRTETTALTGPSLKHKLDDLNDIHNHPKTPEPSPPAPEDIETPKTPSKSDDLEESETKLHDSTSGKYSSPVGPAVGGTIGVLVLVAIVGIMAKRHWPTTEIKYILFHNARSV